MLENLISTTVGELTVSAYSSTDAMAASAAADAAQALRDAVQQRGSARAIVATGNSQYAFVAALADQDIPWAQVTVFHMDEYVGVDENHPASFRRWIRERIEQPFHPAAVEYIDGTAVDVEAEALRYEGLLRAAPIDLTCMGIGENGHLAFNEPGQTDFRDERWAREITLTPRSRAQQVGEGHFPDDAAVPATAISLTVPALLASGRVQVVVPEERKAEAVSRTLRSTGLDPELPASILLQSPQAALYLDPAAATLSRDLLDANV